MNTANTTSISFFLTLFAFGMVFKTNTVLFWVLFPLVMSNTRIILNITHNFSNENQTD